VFGEGIDLPGERLEGAAIVGVGLPAISPERDRIRDHFDRAGGSGFDFAYVFPGMSRVLQAAGRVIRSETDRGAVLLVDERFAQERYRALLPPEWEPSTARSPAELGAILDAFWARRATTQV
jgi:Rad3-related DNA helicase